MIQILHKFSVFLEGELAGWRRDQSALFASALSKVDFERWIGDVLDLLRRGKRSLDLLQMEHAANTDQNELALSSGRGQSGTPRMSCVLVQRNVESWAFRGV